MKNYAVYSMGGDLIASFSAAWEYKPNEKVFVFLKNGQKKKFLINHITHDVYEDDFQTHVVRLYCQENRVFD